MANGVACSSVVVAYLQDGQGIVVMLKMSFKRTHSLEKYSQEDDS